jgi:hypothetical protein
MPNDDATIRRSDVALTFARLCPELAKRRRKRAVEEQARRAPYEVMGDVAQQVAANPEAPWLVNIFAEAERVVGEADQAGAEMVLLGLLENLQNIASHHDTPAQPEQLEAMLGAACSAAWQRLNATWASVAKELPGPTAVSLQQYESVSNQTLKQTLQLTLRRMPDDRLVGLADVLRYEVRHGHGLHLAKLN